MFTSIKIMFAIGVYKDTDVADFVGWGQITSDQYKEITSEEYKTGVA
jgi:phage uncharacterized protein, XkdX family